MANDQRLAKQIEDEAGEAKKFWKPRNQTWAQDRAMLQQVYKNRVKGFETVMSNEPRTQYDLAVAILAGKEPLWTLPSKTQDDPQERERMNKVERFARGVMEEADKRWRQKGHDSWLWEYIWFVAGGGFAAFPHIIPRGRKELEFRCDLFDPLTVYPVFGDTGLVAVFRMYNTTRIMAETMARNQPGWDATPLLELGQRPTAKPHDNVEIVNKWSQEFEEDGSAKIMNTVLADGVIVKEPTEHDEFRRIPIIVRPANGTPYREYDAQEERRTAPFTATWGRSIIDANRQHFKDFDRLLSYMQQNAADHALPTGLDINETGDLTMSNQDTGRAKWIARAIGEDARYMQPPQMPTEIGNMVTYYLGAIQRGGLSHVAFGTLGLEISGVTLEQLLTATRSKLLPYKETAESGLEEIMMEFLDQFRQMRRKVTLLTRERKMGSMGQLFQEDFAQQDIPAHMPIKVELPLALPDDLIQRVGIARQLIPDNTPLADRITVLEDVLKFQDKEMIEARIREDVADQHPIKQAADIAVGLFDRAQAILARASTEAERREALILQRAAVNLLTQMESAAQTGGRGGRNSEGSQRRQPEPRPEQSPSEAGPFSPDVVNRVHRRPNNGQESSRPVSSRDRTRNMGVEG